MTRFFVYSLGFLFVLLLFSTPCHAANYTPALVSPADGATSVPVDASPFTWLSSDAPDHYEIEWATDSDFRTTSMLFSYTVMSTSYSCSGFPGKMLIYWRVIGVANGVRYPSATRSFNTTADDEGFKLYQMSYDDFSTWNSSFWTISGSGASYSSTYKCVMAGTYYNGTGYLVCSTTLPKGGGKLRFKWSYKFYTYYPDDGLYLEYSTDNNSWTTFNTLKGATADTGQTSTVAPGPWRDVEVDFPEVLEGKTFYLRFRFYKTYGYYMFVDDVEFLGKRLERTLSVFSDYGTPVPGDESVFTAGDRVDITVDEHAFGAGDTAKRYQCIGWTGTGSIPLNGVGNLCSVTIYRTSVITWLWGVEYRVIVYSTNSYGNPEPEGTNYYLKDTKVTFSADLVVDIGDPTERYALFHWTGSGSLTGTGSEATFSKVITSASTLTWVYKRQFALTIVSPYPAAGYSPPAGVSWFFENSIVLANCPDFIDRGNGNGVAYAGYQADEGVLAGQLRPVIVQMRSPVVFEWLWTQAWRFDVVTPFSQPLGTQPGWYQAGTMINASIAETYPTQDPGVQWRCKTWAGTGSAPSGVGYEVPEFSLESATSVTWSWVKEYFVNFMTNVGSTNPVSGWFEANSTFTIQAIPPITTATTRYFFLNWQGVGRGSYSGEFPNGSITVMEPLTQLATWRVEHMLTVIAMNGTLASDPTGWYSEGSQVPVTAVSPAGGDGLRWRPKWFGEGSGVVNIAASSNSPFTVAVSVNSPIVQRVEWYRQHMLTVANPEGSGFCVPSPGDYWYFEGDVASGYCVQAFGDRQNDGFDGTGSVSSSGLSYYSFPVNTKSSVSWRWRDRLAPKQGVWGGSVFVSDGDAGPLSVARLSDGTILTYYYSQADDAIVRATLAGSNWTSAVVVANAGDVKEISVAVDDFDIVHIAYFGEDSGQLVYLTDTFGSTKLDAVAETVVLGSLRRAKLVAAAGQVWLSYFSLVDASLYASRKETTGWTTFVVDAQDGAGFFNDIAIPEHDGLPIITFARSGSAKGLYFGRFDGEVWTVETIIPMFAGYFCDMALDGGGVPFVSYQSFDSPDVNSLRCVYFNGFQWVDEIVDANGVTGYNSSILVDADGYIHIAYHNNDSLWYARRTGAGWETRMIAQGDVSGGTGITLRNGLPAVAFVQDGKISYLDATGSAVSGGGGGGGGTTPTTGGGGGCFVATAAFGAFNHNAVMALTSVRDQSLGTSASGSALVASYYAVSPEIASDLRENAGLRTLVRRLLD